MVRVYDPGTADLEGDGRRPGRGRFAEVLGAKAGCDSGIESSNIVA